MVENAIDFFIKIEDEITAKGGYDANKLEGMIAARDAAIMEKCKESVESFSVSGLIDWHEVSYMLDLVLAEIERGK